MARPSPQKNSKGLNQIRIHNFPISLCVLGNFWVRGTQQRPSKGACKDETRFGLLRDRAGFTCVIFEGRREGVLKNIGFEFGITGVLMAPLSGWFQLGSFGSDQTSWQGQVVGSQYKISIETTEVCLSEFFASLV